MSKSLFLSGQTRHWLRDATGIYHVVVSPILQSNVDPLYYTELKRSDVKHSTKIIWSPSNMKWGQRMCLFGA